jgi:hypothetical protein
MNQTFVPAIRAALFVDFDQVFGALHRNNPKAAAAFATNPSQWLDFFESGLHEWNDETDPPAPRSILVRRCYLNPVGEIRVPQPRDDGTQAHRPDQRIRFSDYRVYFTQAAFSVIDCPTLTGHGKNSADIVMVMDILEALDHKTQFDEFIILSGDADFTPVLLKLRVHDRRTTILTDPMTAKAYRNACDYEVKQDDFIALALGMDPYPAPEPRPEPSTRNEHLLDLVARSVADHLAARGRSPINLLTPVFSKFNAFHTAVAEDLWFGQGSLLRLMQELARRDPRIKLDQNDSRSVVAFVGDAAAEPPPAGQDTRQDGSAASDDDVRAQALAVVRQALETASGPLLLSQLGHRVRVEVPDLKGRTWPGATGFRNFLERAQDPRIALLAEPPGYAYDPTRHLRQQEAPDPGAPVRPDAPERPFVAPPRLDNQPDSLVARRLAGLPEELVALAARVAQVSNCPVLLTEEFDALFEAIAGELSQVSSGGDQYWGRHYIASRVYERCGEQALPITRDNVTFVLTALENEDSNWHAEPRYHDRQVLAVAFCKNVEGLCESARMSLMDSERSVLKHWICGGPAPAVEPAVLPAPDGAFSSAPEDPDLGPPAGPSPA